MDEEECLRCLAENVRRRSQKKKLAIETLADLAGVSRAAVWSLLAEEHSPTIRTVVRLANALDCEPADLLRRR